MISVLTPFLSDNVGQVFICITEALKQFGGQKIITGPTLHDDDSMYMETRVRCEDFENFKSYVEDRFPECIVLDLAAYRK